MAAVPLCVDLDGTLIRTDLLWESLVRLLKRNPLYALAVPLWLARGRARLKTEIAARVEVGAAALPYDERFLEFLAGERRAGRDLYLVTACDARLAAAVARHLSLFTDVIATDGTDNVRGRVKGARLTERFGVRGFDYAGNSAVDLPVWEQARHAIVVNAAPRVTARARRRATVDRVFESPRAAGRALVRALRPHQWVKNLILFVPLVTSHRVARFELVGKAVEAFLAFSLCASAVYVLNDLLDLDADRDHPTKRLRPFAAGALPIPVGLGCAPLLLVASAALAWHVSPRVAAVLGCYLALTTSYSWRLKQVALLDVFVLAGLYTLRLVAGHEATRIPYSFWLLAFSMFIFLSLALVKRFRETEAVPDGELKGRGWVTADRDLIAALGVGTGCLSVLVLALYVNSPEVRILYRAPTMLLLVCPLLLYWVSRVWLIAHRGGMDDDPILFALRDRPSYVVGALTVLVLWLAT